jgi:hypothetical protein
MEDCATAAAEEAISVTMTTASRHERCLILTA